GDRLEELVDHPLVICFLPLPSELYGSNVSTGQSLKMGHDSTRPCSKVALQWKTGSRLVQTRQGDPKLPDAVEARRLPTAPTRRRDHRSPAGPRRQGW